MGEMFFGYGVVILNFIWMVYGGVIWREIYWGCFIILVNMFE